MKILKFIKSVCFNFLIILSITIIGVRVAGFVPYNIKTISMEPEYTPNTLVFVKETDFNKLKSGDVITYINEAKSTVTHRIVSVDHENELVITKGDSNDYNDIMPVFKENIVGKVYFKIPLVGIISNIAEKIAADIKS